MSAYLVGFEGLWAKLLPPKMFRLSIKDDLCRPISLRECGLRSTVPDA